MNRPSSGRAPEEARAFAARDLAHTILVDAISLEMSQAFAAAGIPSILLKGPTLSTWLYDHPGERPYLDSDLLVPAAAIDEAEAILRRKGYFHPPLDDLPADRPWHAHAWVRREYNRSLDLHRTLIGTAVSHAETWEVLSRHTCEFPLAGGTVTALDLPARAMHVALHASQDGRRLGKPMVDLERAVARLPFDLWQGAAEAARSLEAVPAFAAGLRLVPEGAEVADRLGLPRTTSPEIALRSAAAPPTSLGFEWLARVPGFRGKVVLLVRKVVPPRAFMEAWSPRARRGPLHLAAAYLYRPLYLLAHAGPGLRAWWRARRTHDG